MPELSPERLAEKILNNSGGLDPFLRELQQLNARLPSRIDADPDSIERGLARLVLTLVDLLRQLMERQAIRRMEGGTLTDDEIERLGRTFQLLAARMEDLKEVFHLAGEDLNLDLGPLGRLL